MKRPLFGLHLHARDGREDADQRGGAPRRPVVLAIVTLGVLAACGAEKEPGSAQQAVDAWVAAVNARDWDRACALDADPDNGCEQRTERGFGPDAGRIRATGRHQSAGALLYGIELPSGSGGLSAERSGDRWRVHPEITVIR